LAPTDAAGRLSLGHPAAPTVSGQRKRDDKQGKTMLFALFYVIAITILVLHFTGFLARHNLEWLVLVLAVATFPAVIYL
jgi:hypothetical protein